MHRVKRKEQGDHGVDIHDAPQGLRSTPSSMRDAVGSVSVRRALMCLVFLLAFVVVFPSCRKFAIRMTRIAGQSSTFMDIRLLVSPGARATHAKAVAYFESQYPLVEESAKNFNLHWYFSHTVPPAKPVSEIGWYDMIGARTRTMAKLLKEHHRDDFRVEKDRCEMYVFFERAHLPFPRIPIVTMSPQKDILKQIRDLSLYDNVSKWPVFMKACHLTQGSMQAVMFIKSREWAAENREEVANWALGKLGRRADDWERPWREEGNMLTDVLQPGIMLQESWHIAYNPYKGFDTPMELKVEVIWGRAYLAVGNDIRTGTLFLRDGTVERYWSYWDQTMFAATLDIDKMKWVFEHLPCVWDLAERAAAIIGAECVRIDVFLWKDHPQQCALNEISISSGMQYAMHFPFLARAWAEPFVKKAYKARNIRAPVYMGNQSLALVKDDA